MTRPDHAREVRAALSDPVKLCVGLGLEKGAQRQSGGLLVCCPVHGERNPSCSVTRGPDGTVRVKCFACDFRGDALTLIAVVEGLSTREADGFREVLAEGARLAGAYTLEAEIRDGRPVPNRERVKAPEPRPEPEYPPQGEVRELWENATAPTEDREASGYLVFRRIDPELVAARRLARVIGPTLPRWASYRHRSWAETGHRLIVRAVDAHGKVRSVRAMRVRDADSPKRLPPAGHKAAELALANEAAWRMLRGEAFLRVVIVEGEPDWLVWSTRIDDPVLGILSGTWTQRFALAIPKRAQVVIRTHNDDAGDRYAQAVIDSLDGRCDLRRSSPEAA